MDSRKTKLTYEDYSALRSMLRIGDVGKIAEKFKISRSTVNRCLDGQTDRYGVLDYAFKLVKERVSLEEDIIRLVRRMKHG